MILSVTSKSNTNEDHDIDKDTSVLDKITYMIDDRHPSKPQIYLTPQQVKRMWFHDQSLAIIMHRLKKDKLCSTALSNTYFLDDDSVLCQSVRDGAHICEAMVVPKMLQQLVLTMIS